MLTLHNVIKEEKVKVCQGEEKTVYKTFKFGKEDSTAAGGCGEGRSVEVRVCESLTEGYAQFVWSCAPVLAHYVYTQRARMPGRRVLELGCGTALPGLLAARLGASVTLSDLGGSLARAHQGCRLNALEHDVRVMELTWGDLGPALTGLEPVDLILGSDCFYNTTDFEPVTRQDALAIIWYFMYAMSFNFYLSSCLLYLLLFTH